METTWFTLGILSMIMATLVTVVVVGIVKVFKMHRQIREFYSHVNDIERYQSDRMVQLERNFSDRLDGAERVIHRSIREEVEYTVTQGKSYTDSRIDKLVDTYFAVKEAEQNTKKLIK